LVLLVLGALAIHLFHLYLLVLVVQLVQGLEEKILNFLELEMLEPVLLVQHN
jgi:hypothetical protein